MCPDDVLYVDFGTVVVMGYRALLTHCEVCTRGELWQEKLDFGGGDLAVLLVVIPHQVYGNFPLKSNAFPKDDIVLTLEIAHASPK